MRRFGPLFLAYFHNRGFRGTWNREWKVSLLRRPFSAHLSVSVGRIREKVGAPDWETAIEGETP